MSHFLHQKIISVQEFLSEPSLVIPEYQRPYKWEPKNVQSLFEDIKMQYDKLAYRLGTIVLHHASVKEESSSEPVMKLKIVDGQQRTLTLTLIVLAIEHFYRDKKSTEAKVVKESLGDLPKKLRAFCDNQKFSSDTSIYNLYNNYQEILRIISRGDFTFEHIEFLLNRCQVVIFVLEDESEAFQFFDSQNSRGKDLYPHDLLKAFHLREFDTQDEDLKANTVAYWENLNDEKLAELFNAHLFRIKHWSQLKSARHFTKDHIDVFKGVNLEKEALPPFAKSLLISHHFVNDYNGSSHRYIDQQSMVYPFQLDQVTINGRRFFEMVKHYHGLTNNIKDATIHKLDNYNQKSCTAFKNGENTCCSVTLFDKPLNGRASAIIHTLNTYDERNRQGDAYTRNLFDNSLIYYIDKFGTDNLSQAVELIFIWAYKLRLEKYAVRLASMDDRAQLSNGMFKKIQQAVSTKAVLSSNMPALKKTKVYTVPSDSELQDTTVNENKYKIYKLFKNLNYLV